MVLCPLHSPGVNQSWRASSGPGYYRQIVASSKRRHHQRQPVVCSGVEHNMSPAKRACFIPSGFARIVLRRSAFHERAGASTRHRAKPQKGNATCSFMVPAGDEVFTEARRSNQKEDVISFTIRHSGVSSQL